MIEEDNLVANILDSVISRAEIELEQRVSLHINKLKSENIITLEKRKELSCDSMDINCRICYDPNQELPIIYPCKCKVWENSVNKNSITQ